MDCLVIGLDMASITILCYKCILRKSAAGLSWDMFVCIAIAAVLFVVPNLEFLLLNEIGVSFVVMVLCAFAILVCFPFYAAKAQLEVPMNGAARPFFCRWYVLLFTSLCIAVLLGDHNPNWNVDLLPLSPGLLLPLYLDALSRIPQLWLVAIEKKRDILAYAFFAAVISSRVVECFNWVYFHSFDDLLLLFPVLFQAVMGIDFLYFFVCDILRRIESQRGNLITLEV